MTGSSTISTYQKIPSPSLLIAENVSLTAGRLQAA
jgi:hypothetical protein